MWDLIAVFQSRERRNRLSAYFQSGENVIEVDTRQREKSAFYKGDISKSVKSEKSMDWTHCGYQKMCFSSFTFSTPTSKESLSMPPRLSQEYTGGCT